MTVNQLRPLVEAAALRQARVFLAMVGDDNPQTVAARNETLGRKLAYEAVLEALSAPRPSASISLNLDAKGLQ